MRLGIWTPLPHTIRAEPAMEAGVRQVAMRGDTSADKSFALALDVMSKPSGSPAPTSKPGC